MAADVPGGKMHLSNAENENETDEMKIHDADSACIIEFKGKKNDLADDK